MLIVVPLVSAHAAGTPAPRTSATNEVMSATRALLARVDRRAPPFRYDVIPLDFNKINRRSCFLSGLSRVPLPRTRSSNHGARQDLRRQSPTPPGTAAVWTRIRRVYSPAEGSVVTSA